MRNVILPALTVLLLCTAVAAQPIVRIDAGQLAGVHIDDVAVYRGIPYAAPPVGQLRWRAPHPVEPWSGVRKADRFGDTCMQDPPPPGSFYQLEFFEVIEPMGEDCLYLNVWTAAVESADERRPVLLWIHGGAFRQGSGSMPSFDGSALALKGLVVVTINYRLGVFGLLAHPELTLESPHAASGNQGLLDMVAALAWVQQNITAFGGDPDNVTIAGQSAGAASVNQLLVSPLADGLFHRAILQSGSSFAFGGIPTLRDAEKTGITLSDSLGVTSLADMRALPADSVHVRGRGAAVGPIIDGYLLQDDPRAIFRSGGQAAVPILIGSTADEGTPIFGPGINARAYRERAQRNYGDAANEYLNLYPAGTDEAAGAMLGVAFSDRLAWGAHTLADIHAEQTGEDVFVYHFARIPPGRESERYRAYHSAELVYVFDALESVDRPWTTIDRRIADQMSSYWARFAANGNPNGIGLREWRAYDAGRAEALVIDEAVESGVVLDPAVINFFDRLSDDAE